MPTEIPTKRPFENFKYVQRVLGDSNEETIFITIPIYVEYVLKLNLNYIFFDFDKILISCSYY
jgi:hypothetical protein